MEDKYQLFIIDPPWPKKKGGLRKVRPHQGRNLTYAIMDLPNIFTLLNWKIFPMADNNHAIFLWEIDEFLIRTELWMETQGYKRHARLIWDKMNGIAPGFSVRYTHEYLVWWYKGRFQPISKESRGRETSVFRELSRQHSRKPNIAYELIKRWYPDKKKLDVFSREKREGFDQWGDEISYFENS